MAGVYWWQVLLYYLHTWPYFRSGLSVSFIVNGSVYSPYGSSLVLSPGGHTLMMTGTQITPQHAYLVSLKTTLTTLTHGDHTKGHPIHATVYKSDFVTQLVPWHFSTPTIHNPHRTHRQVVNRGMCRAEDIHNQEITLTQTQDILWCLQK